MSSIDLLDKTRKLNGLLHTNIKDRVDFSDVCSLLGDAMSASVCVLSAKGKILGKSGRSHYPNVFSGDIGRFIDDSLNQRLLNVLSTGENISLSSLGIEDKGVQETITLITPVDIGGDRLGTLILFRRKRIFSVDDIILSEYASTVVSLEMLRSLKEEEAYEIRSKLDVTDAMAALSATEKTAVVKVFEELADDKGMIVASSISKESGITRSVIVNAIKKLESAGIIRSRSAGVKGTYIEVINSGILDEISNIGEN